jgi:capsid protein
MVLDRRIKKAEQFKAKYDVVDTNNAKKRRETTIETQTEEEILRPYDRMKAINLARDLERNFTGARTILRQFKINVVGSMGKMRLNSENEETNKTVATYFNGIWAKECDSRDDLHFCDVLQLILTSVLREGDVLVAFDEFDRNDGKLIMWEADQLVKISDTEWAAEAVKRGYSETVLDEKGKKKEVPLKQDNGVIYDRRGRVWGYIVTAKHGAMECKLSEATVLRKENAKLLKNPFRFNQLRGVGDLVAAAADLEDIYEMRSKELQSAKVNASIAGYTKSDDALDEAIMRGGVAPESLLSTSEGTSATSTPIKNYDRFETLTGGLWEYLSKGDEVGVLNFERPSIALKDFFEFVASGAGASFGLANCYTHLRANTSYTAYRGEMIMSWMTFESWQKWLERHFCDWIAIKVINFAIKHKKISVELPEGWQGLISWIWNEMPQVDPVNETNAIRERLKLAITDFANELGPDWKEKIAKYKEQIKEIRKDNGLDFLSLFETKAGAPVVSSNNQDSTLKKDNNNGGD